METLNSSLGGPIAVRARGTLIADGRRPYAWAAPISMDAARPLPVLFSRLGGDLPDSFVTRIIDEFMQVRTQPSPGGLCGRYGGCPIPPDLSQAVPNLSH